MEKEFCCGYTTASSIEQLQNAKNTIHFQSLIVGAFQLLYDATSTSLAAQAELLLIDTMSTGALLDQDLGSGSEDDNFNPAPADESDNEGAGDSDPDARPSTKSGTDRRRSRQSDPDDVKEEDDEGHKDSASVLDGSKPFRGPGLNDEDEAENLNGGGADDEDEDEDDQEEDDDEEDVVSVRRTILHIRLPLR